MKKLRSDEKKSRSVRGTVFVDFDGQKLFDDSDGYDIRAKTLISKVKEAWCSNHKINEEDAVYSYQGTVLEKDATPDSLGMEAEGILHVTAVLRAGADLSFADASVEDDDDVRSEGSAPALMQASMPRKKRFFTEMEPQGEVAEARADEAPRPPDAVPIERDRVRGTVFVDFDGQKLFDDSDGYDIRAKTLISKVKEAWCSNHKINEEDAVYSYQGTVLEKDATPDSLGMEAEGILHVTAVLRAGADLSFADGSVEDDDDVRSEGSAALMQGSVPRKKRFFTELEPQGEVAEARADAAPRPPDAVPTEREDPFEQITPEVDELQSLGVNQEMGVNIKNLASKAGKPDSWSAAELRKHIESGANPRLAGILVISGLCNFSVVNHEIDAFATWYKLEQSEAASLQTSASGTRYSTSYILESLGSHMDEDWWQLFPFLKDLWKKGKPWQPHAEGSDKKKTPTATTAVALADALHVRAEVEKVQRAAALAAEQIAVERRKEATEKQAERAAAAQKVAEQEAREQDAILAAAERLEAARKELAGLRRTAELRRLRLLQTPSPASPLVTSEGAAAALRSQEPV